MVASYEDIKDNLIVDLCGTSRNQGKLMGMAHTEVEDMAEVFKIMIENNDNYRKVALIPMSALESWGVSLEQLRVDAYKSAPWICPANMQSMAEILGFPPEMDLGGPKLYVVSTERQDHGASAMFYPGMMDKIAERVGGDFFVLPSSIHEVIITPDDGRTAADELRAIVMGVNGSEVAPEDQLSDNAYHYDSKNHIFELAEKFEARKERKAEQEQKPEKKKHKSNGR